MSGLLFKFHKQGFAINQGAGLAGAVNGNGYTAFISILRKIGWAIQGKVLLLINGRDFRNETVCLTVSLDRNIHPLQLYTVVNKN